MTILLIGGAFVGGRTAERMPIGAVYSRQPPPGFSPPEAIRERLAALEAQREATARNVDDLRDRFHRRERPARD